MRKVVSLAVIFIMLLQFISAEVLSSKNYEVSLKYTPHIEVLEVGFVNTDDITFDTPVTGDMEAGDITLVFDTDSNKATGPQSSSPCYIYWKVCSDTAKNISISAGNLENPDNDPISYTVNFIPSDSQQGDIDDLGSGNGNRTISYDGGNAKLFGIYQIDIETENLTDKATADYRGTITVSIVEGGNG